MDVLITILTVFLIAFFVFIILFKLFYFIVNAFNRKVKKTKEKVKVTLDDIFAIKENHGGDSDTDCVYLVVKDEAGNRYAFMIRHSNLSYKFLDKAPFIELRQSTTANLLYPLVTKKGKKVQIGESGYLWINKVQCLLKEMVVFKNDILLAHADCKFGDSSFGGREKLNRFYNYNEANNEDVLDTLKYITGYAEFE